MLRLRYEQKASLGGYVRTCFLWKPFHLSMQAKSKVREGAFVLLPLFNTDKTFTDNDGTSSTISAKPQSVKIVRTFIVKHV